MYVHLFSFLNHVLFNTISDSTVYYFSYSLLASLDLPQLNKGLKSIFPLAGPTAREDTKCPGGSELQGMYSIVPIHCNIKIWIGSAL